jgi:hypothetical protein
MTQYREVYFSTDVETDGPIPGRNSMLSLAAVAILRDGTRLDAFAANLRPLDGAVRDAKTMADFWDKNPEAWAAVTRDPEDPSVVMSKFKAWITGVCRRPSQLQPFAPVFAAYPAGFDFMFVHWYFQFFLNGDPFSHSALDMKTLAMAILQKPYRRSTKRDMPRTWFVGQPKHSHVALDDAEGQAMLLAAMFQASERR